MALYTKGRERDSNLAREKIAPLAVVAEAVQVIKSKIAAITLVSETRNIIPSGTAITEKEQEE